MLRRSRLRSSDRTGRNCGGTGANRWGAPARIGIPAISPVTGADVSIDSGLGGNAVGGYTQAQVANATDNTVALSGLPDLSRSHIRGGKHLGFALGAASGNRLLMQTSFQTGKNIYKFAEEMFRLPATETLFPVFRRRFDKPSLMDG